MLAIYLRRRLKVVVPDGQGETPLAVVAALQKNISSLGFVLATEVAEQLLHRPLEVVETFYRDLVEGLRARVGAHREFRPMYPNFPSAVMEMSAARLYWNAVVHYWTGLLPQTDPAPRPPLLERGTPKIIQPGSRSDFEGIFTALAGARTSISAQDREDVCWFIRQYRDDIERLLPDALPNRENLAVVGAALFRETRFGAGWLDAKLQTATDVLRLAVALGGGDVSLAESTKFKKIRRDERRRLLGWIERCGNPTEDMLRWKDRWIRLGERLHPGEWAARFPKAAAAFAVLRDGLPFQTFNARVEASLRSADGAATVALLKARPGELTRRLDHLLRSARDPEVVVREFGGVAGAVSSPVLLQAMSHFSRRDERAESRAFFPKGDVARVQVVPNALPALPPGTAAAIAQACERALLARFAKLPPLGRCWLDQRLTDYLVPFSQRSAAKSLRTLVRGSRLPLPECRVLRFFIWWRNGRARTDIDLSAALYDADFNYVDVISYYNLQTFGGCHSGDIVDAPQGAAEFIDLNVTAMLARRARYLVMSINSYTRQPFCDLPECFAGWMARQEADSGEIFEPRTVQDRVDVASNTQVCLPAIFDLHEKQVIWADIALQGFPIWNNVANHLSNMTRMLKGLVGLRKPSLHTLFALHIRARGELVANPADAETVFGVEQGLTPFELDRIAAEYL